MCVVRGGDSDTSCNAKRCQSRGGGRKLHWLCRSDPKFRSLSNTAIMEGRSKGLNCIERIGKCQDEDRQFKR